MPEWALPWIAGVLFIIATNTQSGWLYVVLALLLGIMVVGFVGPRRMVRGLTIWRRVQGDVAEGQAATVEIYVRNSTRWPRYFLGLHEELPGCSDLAAHERWRRFTVAALGPGETAVLQYQMPCPRRGVHRFAPLIVDSATPFGLYAASHEYPTTDALVVYPVGPYLKEVPVRNAVAHRPNPQQSVNVLGHSHDFVGIRDYISGEDTRHIHWPSVAKHRQLMLKEFKDVSSQNIVILIDSERGTELGSGRDTTLEYAVKAATSVADYARRNSLSLTLMATRDQEVRVVRHPRGKEHLQFLASVQAEGRLSWEKLLDQARSRVPVRSHLYIMTSRPDLPADLLLSLMERRTVITVVLFDASTFDESSAKSAAIFQAMAYEDCVRRLASPQIAVNHYRKGGEIPLYLDGHARRGAVPP